MLLSSAYHPKTDGQTERVSQCLEMCLKLSSFHTGFGVSPFHALYGHEPNMGVVPHTSTTTPREVGEVFQNIQQQALILKLNLAKAQNRMKMLADRNKSDRQYQVGEKVLLKLRPYAPSSVVNRPYPKLSFNFFWALQGVGQNLCE